jgi:hypothetical protein
VSRSLTIRIGSIEALERIEFDPDPRLISEVLRARIEDAHRDEIIARLERVRAWDDMLKRARRRASEQDGGLYE